MTFLFRIFLFVELRLQLVKLVDKLVVVAVKLLSRMITNSFMLPNTPESRTKSRHEYELQMLDMSLNLSAVVVPLPSIGIGRPAL